MSTANTFKRLKPLHKEGYPMADKKKKAKKSVWQSIKELAGGKKPKDPYDEAGDAIGGQYEDSKRSSRFLGVDRGLSGKEAELAEKMRKDRNRYIRKNKK